MKTFLVLMLAATVPTAAVLPSAAQAPAFLHSRAGYPAELRSASPSLASPGTEVVTTFGTRLIKADATHRGQLWLVVDALGDNGEHATLRAPLSSTEEAYGEERTCTAAGMTYTAGLEEANYVAFKVAGDWHDYRVLLNRLLCRLLAAPFQCGGKAVPLQTPWQHWRLGRVRVRLESDASATLQVSEIKVEQTLVPFDDARCAVVAPSNGFCCVQGQTTEWHCGGTPIGEGWHQVSGECFHRETGEVCHD